MAASQTRRAAVWIVVGLLCLGMVGFGATSLTSQNTTLGSVGSKDISMQGYANALNQQIRAFSEQVGVPINFGQAQALGIDRAVLTQAIADRALDTETEALGLSVGDTFVREQVLLIPAFRGLNGEFDRERYRIQIDGSGQTEAAFEATLREDLSRALLRGAVAGGVDIPAAYGATMMAFEREVRSITWAMVTPAMVTAPAIAPTDADLQAYYDANPQDFTLPEVRNITYAWLTPEMIQGQVTVDDQAVQDLYQQRISEFVRPERRLVERLVFANDADAEAAIARVLTADVTFDALVAERGLNLSDIDLGDVVIEDLGEAGPGIFAGAVGEVLGPLPSPLGPALFRLNAVLAADETTFADAEADLRLELANDRARRIIGDSAEGITNLLAGGATLEDVAANTDLELGTIAWTAGLSDGIAAYDSFRAAAAVVAPDAFPELQSFEDGGMFLIRLDSVTPPTLQPFADVADRVRAGWDAAAKTAATLAEAERLAEVIRTAGGFDAPGVTVVPTVAPNLARTEFVEGTPPDFLTRAFALAAGDVAVIPHDDGAIILRIDAVTAPDPTDPAVIAARDMLHDETAAAVASDIFDAFAAAIQQGVDIQIDEAALNAVHASFQ